MHILRPEQRTLAVFAALPNLYNSPMQCQCSSSIDVGPRSLTETKFRVERLRHLYTHLVVRRPQTTNNMPKSGHLESTNDMQRFV